jgi:KDO2-lipid IV(A) lauroyltransferase
MTAKERESLALKVFEHFGIVAVDFVSTESRRPEELLASVDVEGWDHLERAIAVGKGVLLLTGHFGNWERFAHYGTLTGVEVSVVARDADHPGLQAKIARLRESAGMNVLSRGSAARAILGALKQRKVVGLLPDQNSAESFLPFFGRPTGTVLGPAVLHLRTGAPMIPLYCARVGVGRYRILIEQPLEPLPGVENVQEALMSSYNASLERAVREHPEQWLWFHDRWKSARQEGLL